MKESTKAYIFFTGTGAVFGITTSVLSGLSNDLVKVPLGFSPLSFKNLIKVGVISGATAAGIFTIELKWDVLQKIMNKINQLL